jgi:hypothetical protein
MSYPLQIVQDYRAWQELGSQEFQQHAPYGGEVLARHLGRNIGAYGVFGTMFYDIAHHGVLAPAESRSEVARQSIWIAGALEIIDDTIDRPTPSRTTTSIETFLDNCRDTMLEGAQRSIVPGIALPEQQLACYGIATIAHKEMSEKGYADKKTSLANLLDCLKSPVLRQFEATDPFELLKITEDTSGYCSEATVLSSEFVDQTDHTAMRKAAWHFGAVAGILDHGSELLEDVQKGSTTFATAYLHEHGISDNSLHAIRTIRKEAAREQYNAGKKHLEGLKERSIYAIAGSILTARYAVKRAQEGVTPRKLEATWKRMRAPSNEHTTKL